LSRITAEAGSLLILDEVMTGFRLAYGGAQERYGVGADLTTLGKVIGGGLPVGAYGGRQEIMDCVAPMGPVYQAGTLSGNPLAVAAGIATLKMLRRPGVYDSLESHAKALQEGLVGAANRAGITVSANRVGSMFTLFFTHREPNPKTSQPDQGPGTAVTDWLSAKQSDVERFGRFFREMLRRGIYLAPSQFEAGFLSLAHTLSDVRKTVEAAQDVFAAMSNRG
jgi:glutamate-1-semialdehyde 2,1-aminomutase